MKTTLLVLLLLVVVLTVSARRPRNPRNRQKGCQVPNCQKCQSKPYLCDECDHGFIKSKLPLGYGCVKKQGNRTADCGQNCKTCKNRFSCAVCEHGHVLYKGVVGIGKGRCIDKCPSGFKTEVNTMGGNECVKHCTPNCKTCRGSSCSVCEQGYALYKGVGSRGNGRCVQKCPRGYKTKVNLSGGNECVKQCTPNCKTCRGSSCSVCDQGYTLYKGVGSRGNGRCVQKCPRGYKTEVNLSGGNECVKRCTPNCKTCRGSSCSVCEQGHALFKSFRGWGRNGRCVQKCPRGYKTEVNPSGGNKCVKQCTSHCKTCQNKNSCSVCERGHALHKGFKGLGPGRCIQRCPKGYAKVINPMGGDKCAKQCLVKNCQSCPITWVPRRKCTKCKPGYYKLSVGKPWQSHDFCFSHCPSGYVPKIVGGIAVCQPKTETTTDEPTPEPEWTTEGPEPDDTTTTTEPHTICDTEPISSTTEPTTIPEPMTEPEPTTISTDFWP